jgi:GTP-binding protein
VSAFPHARFLLSVAAPKQLPPDAGIEVAFAGRSNAGKSSAINAITGRKALARTSRTPGQTRFLNYFELAPAARIVDLPGYGYAAVPPAERAKWLPLVDALRERAALRGLFLIVDARRGVKPEDLALVEWADPTRRAVHVLLAKSDKLNRTEARRTLAEAQDALDGAATAQVFSAHDATGVDAARSVLRQWLEGGGSSEKTPVTSREITGAD